MVQKDELLRIYAKHLRNPHRANIIDAKGLAAIVSYVNHKETSLMKNIYCEGVATGQHMLNWQTLMPILSFNLGYFMARGLFKNYPNNFNRLLPALTKRIIRQIPKTVAKQTKKG